MLEKSCKHECVLAILCLLIPPLGRCLLRDLRGPLPCHVGSASGVTLPPQFLSGFVFAVAFRAGVVLFASGDAGDQDRAPDGVGCSLLAFEVRLALVVLPSFVRVISAQLGAEILFAVIIGYDFTANVAAIVVILCLAMPCGSGFFGVVVVRHAVTPCFALSIHGGRLHARLGLGASDFKLRHYPR